MAFAHLQRRGDVPKTKTTAPNGAKPEHALNLHGRLTLTFRRRFGENFPSAPRSNNNGCGALSRSGTISQLMVCTILDSAETECESKGRRNWGLLPWTSIPNLNLLQKVHGENVPFCESSKRFWSVASRRTGDVAGVVRHSRALLRSLLDHLNASHRFQVRPFLLRAGCF